MNQRDIINDLTQTSGLTKPPTSVPSTLEVLKLLAGLAVLAIVFIIFVLIVQFFIVQIHLLYLKIRYGFNVPEPHVPFLQRYTVGHNLGKLLVGQRRDITSKQFLRWKKKYNGIFVTISLMGEPNVNILTAEGIRHVTSNKYAENFRKPQIFHNTIQSLTGSESIVLVGGKVHSRLRRLVTPAFHYSSLTSISNIFFRHAALLKDALLSVSDGACREQPDLIELVHDRVFGLIIDACFGDGVVHPAAMDRLRKDYFKCINEPSTSFISRWLLQRYFSFLPARWMGYEEKRKEDIKKTLKSLLRITSNMYTSTATKSSSSKGTEHLSKVPNMLSIIAGADDDKLSADETISLILTFISAGQISTTFALSWLLDNLARHPAWQTKVRSELEGSGWSPTEEDALKKLDALPILDRVVKESLRRDPPISFTSRETKCKEIIDGVLIPPGVLLRFPIHAHQTDPDVWGDDANDFNPDRWLDPKLERIPTFYTIFWHGQRGCIGQRFAILELKAFAAIVVQHIQLSVKPGDPEPYAQGLFTKPLGLKLYTTPLKF